MDLSGGRRRSAIATADQRTTGDGLLPREGHGTTAVVILPCHQIRHLEAQGLRTLRHVANLVDKLGDLAGQFQDGSNVRMVLSRARAAHMGWKTRVRAYLDGQEGLSRSEAVSDKECRLGHWYFSEGQACCGDQPAFRAMAAPHARLHQVIQQIIELKNQHKHEEAEALYREIEQNSEQVVGCIDQLLREMTKPER